MAPTRISKTKEEFGRRVTIREAARQERQARLLQSSLGESEELGPVTGPPLAPIGTPRRSSSRSANEAPPTRRSGGRSAAQAGPSTPIAAPAEPGTPRQTLATLPSRDRRSQRTPSPERPNRVAKTPSPRSKRVRRASAPSPKGTPSKPKYSPSEGTFGRTRSGRSYAAPARPTTVFQVFEDLNFAPGTRLPALVNTLPLLEEVPVVAEGIFDTLEELGLLRSHGRFLRMLLAVAVAIAAGKVVGGFNIVAPRVPDDWQVEWHAARLADAELWRDLAYRDDVDVLLAVIRDTGLDRLPRPEGADGEAMSNDEIRDVGRGTESERRGRTRRKFIEARLGRNGGSSLRRSQRRGEGDEDGDEGGMAM